MIKPIIIRITIVIIIVSAVVLGRWGFFYKGFYDAPATEILEYENIVVPLAPSVEFFDNYAAAEGVVLIDLAHDNDFDIEELHVLILRLVSRGLTIKFLRAGDNLEKELLGEKEEEATDQKEPSDTEPVVKGEKPEEEAAAADAFIVVSPGLEFSREEKKTINKFLDDGGKLLLIADPTRRSEMNSLSFEFGLIFEPDYLYNQKENDVNYRNIFIADFGENEITRKLGKIALYTAGSISSANSSIAFVDENTFSNVVAARGRLSPIALAQESRVLALYDITFMAEPNNGVLDNNQLIANIADWLAAPAEDL